MGALTPEDIIDAYKIGVFPMAERATDDDVFWVSPEWRGVIPLDKFHVSKSLRKFLKRRPYRVTINRAFDVVMRGCAEATPDRPETWINASIFDVYNNLHRMGYTHSVECWDDSGRMVGGLYGVAIAGAFFGESMFSRAQNASKVALVHLVARLKARGYRLLDCQFLNAHLKQFGCEEITRERYHSLLSDALSVSGVSFVDPSEIYASSASSVGDFSSSTVSPSSGVLSCDSDWDSALGFLQSSTVTS